MKLVVFIGLCLLSTALGRFRREGEKLDDKIKSPSLNEIKKHVYYVLVKNDGLRKLESPESLSTEFAKRLGEDQKVKITAASQDKILVEIDGDGEFSNKIVDALKSFPEISHVEKKPEFRTRNRPLILEDA
eukprot:CAMPEP_0113679252 /NCGR_PEP_ID=MMETSP0038_2-20120614/10497_1 /TAXON_ID=2898 /ORGANISM="Cryptomonas paramecium" /LENGTH=130 /DNA_ID=CAMNT_0000597175 /DNA_START=12 /DNA_END=404 /DNA_ORIENTATION=- /assembly_acc=CAM_ASM_000170